MCRLFRLAPLKKGANEKSAGIEWRNDSFGEVAKPTTETFKNIKTTLSRLTFSIITYDYSTLDGNKYYKFTSSYVSL